MSASGLRATDGTTPNKRANGESARSTFAGEAGGAAADDAEVGFDLFLAGVEPENE